MRLSDPSREDAVLPSADANDGYAPAHLRPGLVAAQDNVGADLVCCGEHERIGDAKASVSAAESRGTPSDLRRDRRHLDREVREEDVDLGHRLMSRAVRRNQDLGVDGRRRQKVVVLVNRKRGDARLVQRVLGIEEADDDGRIEND